MSNTIVQFRPKYREGKITVENHPENGIVTVNLGGAVVYGKPELATGDGWHSFHLRKDDGCLIFDEFLAPSTYDMVAERLESADW